jgi:hypothetical protein
MSSDDPFFVLGLSPTLDPATIKRAYFHALSRTPPHADPQGFRRLRAAYETLSDPRALPLAWLRSPVDTEAELARWQERFGARVEAASAESRRARREARAVERLIERVTRMRVGDVIGTGDPVGLRPASGTGSR